MENLFVYGTLLFPEIVEKLTGKTFQTSPAILHGYRRCQLSGCDYPAITEIQNSQTDGALLFDVDKESMKKIEAFEGDEYEKMNVTVYSDKQKFEAVAFVWKSDRNLLTESNWNQQEFEKKNLKNYVD